MNNSKKFRVWDKINKSFLQEMTPYYWHVPFSLTGNDDEPEGEANLCSLSELLRYQDKFIIQQYTGLNDSKGNEIFEGDIVFWSSLRFKVEWDDWGFKWSAVCPYYVVYKRATTVEHFRHLQNGTIVGNIFETPELLLKS